MWNVFNYCFPLVVNIYFVSLVWCWNLFIGAGEVGVEVDVLVDFLLFLLLNDAYGDVRF